MSKPPCSARRWTLAPLAFILVVSYGALSNGQSSGLSVTPSAPGQGPGCKCRAQKSSTPTCILGSCSLLLQDAPGKLSLSNLRDWLPSDILPSEQTPVLLTGVTLALASCAPLWILQVDACTFRLAAAWPSAGLQTGRGFIYFPSLISGRSTSAQRLNVTCPLHDWTLLETAAAAAATETNASTTVSEEAATGATPPLPLSPCGTATVTTVEELLMALNDLQNTHARVFITLAANISLPAPPDGSAGTDEADDPQPLVRIYRNVTLAGLGSPGNSRGQPTELNMSLRRNAFQLLQPRVDAAATADVDYKGDVASIRDAVVMTFADMALVNVPAGPRSTWPTGLVNTDMWHIAMDRSLDAVVQLIHLRVVLVLRLTQTKYFSYWYSLAVSLVNEERAAAAWILDLVSPTVKIYSMVDGSPTTMSRSGSYIERYNSSGTSVPLLTTPSPPLVDLWALGEPPPPPSVIGFATSAEELAAELDAPRTGSRVIVILNNITLNETTWPKDGYQLVAGVTLASPFGATTPLGPHRPTLDLRGLYIARTAPGTSTSFRNLRLLSLFMSISWALTEAPATLPGVPRYAAWRSMCLPGLIDDSKTKYKLHGCEVDVTPEAFKLLQVYNNLPCASAVAQSASSDGSDGSGGNNGSGATYWNCTNATTSAAAVAALFPQLPVELDAFFQAVFFANGNFAPSLLDSDTILFSANMLAAAEMNTTIFKLVRQGDSNSPSPPASTSTTSLSSPPLAVPINMTSLTTSCSMQSLFTILAAAPVTLPPASVDFTQPTLIHGSRSSHRAIIAGVIAGTVAIVLVTAMIITVLFVVHRRRSPSRDTADAWKAPLAAPDATPTTTAAIVLLPRDGQGSCSGGCVQGPGRGDSDCVSERATSCRPEAAVGNRIASTVNEKDRAAGGGCATGPVAAAGERASSAPANLIATVPLQLETTSAGKVSGSGAREEGERCSAFSKSFAAADAAPTMLELLLGQPVGPTDMWKASPVGGFDRFQGGARRDGFGRDQKKWDAAKAYCGGECGSSGCDAPGCCKAAAAGAPGARGVSSSSTGENVRRVLKGQIDGLMRHFEATTSRRSNEKQSSSQGGLRQRVLGNGGFGVVYKGEWRGLPVAIKVVLLQDGDSVVRRERLVREVALSATLSHPNVVPTYHYIIKPVGAAVAGGRKGILAPAAAAQRAAGPAANINPLDRRAAPDLDCIPPAAATDADADSGIMAYQLSIIMAYCDMGTLKEALHAGVFRKPWPPLLSGTVPTPSPPTPPSQQQQQQEGVVLQAAEAIEAQNCEGHPSGGSSGDPKSLQAAGARPSGEGRLESWRDIQAAPNMALALFAAVDVARGLSYLHSCNVVHGDLSLQNILLTSAEPIFTDVVVNASGGTVATATAAIAAAFRSCPADTAAAAAEQPHFYGSSTGDTAAAADGAAAIKAPGTVVEAAVAASAGNNSLRISLSNSGPSTPPPPMQQRPFNAARQPAVAEFAETVEISGGIGSSDTAADTISTGDPAALATIMSTYTQSGTLGKYSEGTTAEDTMAFNMAMGAVSEQLMAMTMTQRLAAVHPLLMQVFKISDFGLSVRLEGDETHRSGLHQGTPYYTAGEVLACGTVSPAADIYSYGVCLWCLVHSVSLSQLRHLLPPMFSPVAPTLLAHMSPDLHPGLRSMLRRCLAGEPSRRPQAVQLLGELQALLQVVLGPELAQRVLRAKRRERDGGRTVTGSLPPPLPASSPP